jgi:hypothetical protein
VVLNPKEANAMTTDTRQTGSDLRTAGMETTCSIQGMDHDLVRLFRAIMQDEQADLCAVLSSRRRAMRYIAKTTDGRFEITLTPDSPQQRVHITLRHGDVFYELSRGFGEAAPYGGSYKGIKFYAEVGAVPLSDNHVQQLLLQWNVLFEKTPATQWERFLQMLTPNP